MRDRNSNQMTVEHLRNLFSYDQETGVFTRQISKGTQKAGSVAGGFDKNGYVRIKIDGKFYKAHRVAWFYVNGVWPKNEIDHINGIPSDNRIANLREATRLENCQNRSINVDNKSGYRGVHWHKQCSKWAAHIRHQGKKIYLGLFETAQEAGFAAETARQKLFTHHRI